MGKPIQPIGDSFLNSMTKYFPEFIAPYDRRIQELETKMSFQTIKNNEQDSTIQEMWIELERLRTIYSGGSSSEPLNLVLNGTFADNTNVIFSDPPKWSISSGVVSYLATDEPALLGLTLSEPIINGGEYDIVFTISNVVTNARIEIWLDRLVGTQILTRTSYANGTYTINYTHTGVNRNELTFYAYASAGASTFDLDNVTMTEVTVGSIINVTSVSISPATLTINIGATSQLIETMLPVDATDKTGIWSSNNVGICTVSSTGLVTAIAAGTATITFTTTDGSFTDTTVTTVETATLKAFPSAYGAAANITGGRSATVIHVTDLTNNNSPGSFRWAISRNYPRIVVFDVSGSIDLGGTSLQVSGSQYNNLTIAGQTAPEGGITIINGTVWFEFLDNLIIRYIKFRGGSYTNDADSLQISRGSNILVDHCEGWYGDDEGMDVGDSPASGTDGTITVQNCLIAESATGLIMGKSWAGEADWNFQYGPVSVLRNAFINVSHRFPKAGGALSIDVINNVVHNWEARLIRIDPDDFILNEINNYYQSGVNSSSGLNYMWVRPWMTPQIYTAGNFISTDKKPVGYDANNRLGWDNFNNDYTYTIDEGWFVGSQLPLQGVTPTILTAVDSKAHVLLNVGAIHYLNADGTVGTYRDNLMTTYLGYLDTDSNVARLASGSYGTQATGVPNNTRPGGFYGTNQHIPAAYLTAKGITNTLTVHNDIAPSGYTWIEEYHNQVDN